jgi:hypothetical protein
MAVTHTSETLPADHKAAIRQMKQELRAQIGDVQAVFDRLTARIAARLEEIDALKASARTSGRRSRSRYARGQVTRPSARLIKRRGCAVIKGHFSREQALAWDNAMLDYLDRNHFDDVYKGPGDTFFGSLEASRPEIYPIYWSQAQMQARQSDEMAAVQSFLNRLWTFNRDGKQWFDPDVSVIYPDRIRRRPPGTTSKGLARIPIPARWSAGCCRPISRCLPTCLTAILMLTIRGTPRTVPKWKSTPSTTPPNARCSAPSRVDRALRYDPRSGSAARGADPGSDGLRAAASAAR